MWTIVIAVCYAPMFTPAPPRCQVLQETSITYHMTKEECLGTTDTHREALSQNLASQGMRVVHFETKCVQAGDPA